ncbi:oxygenase MpaB family protein [Pendulispora albinea]|uniref:DUF2236 domain-containing protein n=1 Tax=Pendulispora albinea TaxID=2741071 RepID=A0ABZ2LNL9_9BACT
MGAALGPDSLAWTIVGERRVLLAAGRALLLQVSHPAVGAGVVQYSDFKRDPWGRFERTLSMLRQIVYGGDAAIATARKLRAMHARIHGIDAHGCAYHALDREPFAWVHAATFETVLAACAHFGEPLTGDETARLYAEFRLIGNLYGVADRDLPENVDGFRAYYARMLAEQLEPTQAGRDALASMKSTPVHPRWSRAWWPVFRGIGALSHFVTVGLLPSVVRERYELPWTAADARAFRAFCAAVRAGWRLVPFELRYHRDAKAAFRREARARASVARTGGAGGR